MSLTTQYQTVRGQINKGMGEWVRGGGKSPLYVRGPGGLIRIG